MKKCVSYLLIISLLTCLAMAGAETLTSEPESRVLLEIIPGGDIYKETEEEMNALHRTMQMLPQDPAGEEETSCLPWLEMPFFTSPRFSSSVSFISADSPDAFSGAWILSRPSSPAGETTSVIHLTITETQIRVDTQSGLSWTFPLKAEIRNGRLVSATAIGNIEYALSDRGELAVSLWGFRVWFHQAPEEMLISEEQ